MPDDVYIYFSDIDTAVSGPVLFYFDRLPTVSSSVSCSSAAHEQILCTLTEIDEPFANAELIYPNAEIAPFLHTMYPSIAPHAGNTDISNEVFPDRYRKINGHK